LAAFFLGKSPPVGQVCAKVKHHYLKKKVPYPMRRVFLLLTALMFSVFGASGAWAMDTVMLSPERVIIGPKQNAFTLTLTNTGTKELSYQLGLQDEVMQPEGGLTTAPEGFPYSLRRMLRFSPQTITVPAGEVQYVRLLVRRPPGLEDGDYHSHLVLTQIDNPTPAEPVAETLPESTFKLELGTKVDMLVPVFVQHGQLSSKVVVDKVTVPTAASGGDLITLNLQRLGNASTVNRITVQTPDGKDLTKPRNQPLYRENDAYTISLRIIPAMKDYTGPVVVTVRASGDLRAPVIHTSTHTR
jgi:hypothetical protein